MISSQPTGEAVRERFGLLGEAKSDSKKNSANILMVVEDGCLVLRSSSYTRIALI